MDKIATTTRKSMGRKSRSQRQQHVARYSSPTVSPRNKQTSCYRRASQDLSQRGKGTQDSGAENCTNLWTPGQCFQFQLHSPHITTKTATLCTDNKVKNKATHAVMLQGVYYQNPLAETLSMKGGSKELNW